MISIVTHSEDETVILGEKIGQYAGRGSVILIRGDLGAGKTVLVKGIARGLDITDTITSPTYTLIHEYRGRLELYHFDLYRLEAPDEIYELGYEEYVFGDGVTVVDWPERMEGLLPDDYLEIIIEREPSQGTQGRKITLNPVGRGFNNLKGVLEGL